MTRSEPDPTRPIDTPSKVSNMIILFSVFGFLLITYSKLSSTKSKFHFQSKGKHCNSLRGESLSNLHVLWNLLAICSNLCLTLMLCFVLWMELIWFKCSHSLIAPSDVECWYVRSSRCDYSMHCQKEPSPDQNKMVRSIESKYIWDGF
jgi:hypothetical protein